VIGFDGLDVALVRQWANEGHLPAFAGLLETSTWTQFLLPPEYSSGMVWPSINTGLEPSVHKSHFGIHLVDGTYKLRPRHHSDIRGTPFWNRLAAQGRRLVLMDVPFARVDPSCNGKQIVGWGQHEWGWPIDSHPRDLLAQVERIFGRYPLTRVAEDTFSFDGAGALLDELLRGVEQRTRILCHLTRDDDWDVFYSVFQEAHSIGHSLWHLSDASHPRFDKAIAATIGNPLLRLYCALDAALRELLDHLGNDLELMIILSHGMGPNYNGNHLFPELLARFNHSRTKLSTRARVDETGQTFWGSTIGQLPPQLRRYVEAHTPWRARRWLSAKRKQHSRHWRRAVSFALPGLDGFSALRVNLAGREPGGIVRVGKEYDEHLDAIQAESASWTIGETERRAVARVHRAARGQDALRLGAAPDLMIWWDQHCPIEEIRSPALGVVRGHSRDERTGEHVMHSLVLLRRPEGSAGSKSLLNVGVTDIAPMICELADVPWV